MGKSRKMVIGILTLGRTDYSYFKPIIQEIAKDRALDYYLIAVGMSLSPDFGTAFQEIIQDGFRVDEKIESTLSSNTPEGAAKTTGLITLGMVSILTKGALDALLVFGDRFETLGAVTGALPYNIPIAHIFGGDTTEGAFDERIRHAITKISHIHFPSNELSAKRILQMGEEPWRVFNVGSPSVDMMKAEKLYSKKELLDMYGLDPSKKLFLITYHPVTLEVEDTPVHIHNLIKALERFDANMMVTYPNSDPASKTIVQRFDELCQRNKNVRFIKKLGVKGFYSAMKHSDVMIGNSSSGVLESATFKLPVVNIGNRQKHRLAGKNVLNSGYGTSDIIKKIERAQTASFKKNLKNIRNPHGNGDSSRRIIGALKKILSQRTHREIITKRFIIK